jgi:hypothetical protein
MANKDKEIAIPVAIHLDYWYRQGESAKPKDSKSSWRILL